jgi:hypothetical protein
MARTSISVIETPAAELAWISVLETLAAVAAIATAAKPESWV